MMVGMMVMMMMVMMMMMMIVMVMRPTSKGEAQKLDPEGLV